MINLLGMPPGLWMPLAASLLLGIGCGLIGSFVVVRRMALAGDAVSHAVLPGVVAGFVLSPSRNPLVVLGLALTAGLLGMLLVRAITTTTRLKEDAALGIVLAVFFALGISAISVYQPSGVTAFLYGQAAAVSWSDLLLMTGVTALVATAAVIFARPLVVMSFDAGFASSLGYPVRLFERMFALMLTAVVVVAMQAVGVILVSAMLITPAAAAYLLTDRFNRMMLVAAGFGAVAGVAGTLISFARAGLPTGPLIALVASGVFAAVFFAAPNHGVVAKWLRLRGRSARVARENYLKAIYQVLEARSFHGDGVSVREIAERRRETLEDATRGVQALVRTGEAFRTGEAGDIFLTPDGWRRAAEIVRNHRLWELYLTHQADYDADHVHDDAERIEHLLGEETVRQLERALAFPETDPHGSPIPAPERQSVGKGELR
jgi:manganese/zinc/iron transport system permease protein